MSSLTIEALRLFLPLCWLSKNTLAMGCCEALPMAAEVEPGCAVGGFEQVFSDPGHMTPATQLSSLMVCMQNSLILASCTAVMRMLTVDLSKDMHSCLWHIAFNAGCLSDDGEPRACACWRLKLA